MVESAQSRRSKPKAAEESAVAEPQPDAAPEPAVEIPPLTKTQKIDAKGTPDGLRRPMEQGDRGPRVAEVQTLLARSGQYTGRITGLFGYETVRAVRRFQSTRDIRLSGVVDSATWVALQQGGKR